MAALPGRLNANSPQAVRVKSFGVRALPFFEPQRGFCVAGGGVESTPRFYALKFLFAGVAIL